MDAFTAAGAATVHMRARDIPPAPHLSPEAAGQLAIPGDE